MMLEDVDIKLDLPENEERKSPFEGFANAMMQNLDVKGYARWVLYSIKAEITMNEFRFLIYWTSLIELGLMTIAFVLLLMAGRFWIFLHLLHFARPFLGLKVISSLPKSHDVFEELPSLTDASSMQPVIFAHFKRANSQMTRFLVVSAVCILLDVIGCIVSFVVINDRHNADFFYGIVAWIFLCFDSLLVFWYNTLRWMYPDAIWQNFRGIMKSGLGDARSFLGEYFRSVQNRFKRGSS
jgi:hypothetical protein